MNIMMKYAIPNMMNIAEIPTLFWSASMIGVAIAFARPKPIMDMPVAIQKRIMEILKSGKDVEVRMQGDTICVVSLTKKAERFEYKPVQK